MMYNDSMQSKQKKALHDLERLESEYPNYQTLLYFNNAFELLIAVILSAQTTDEQVNGVTPALFQNYPSPEALSTASISDIERIVFTTGFYKNKTKNIIGTAKALVEKYKSTVPSDMETLTSLPGVGRKTAGVVLFHIFDIPAIIVDTHFGRLCRRLAWTEETDPKKVEDDIAVLLPREKWGIASMVVNYHGRRVCKSRLPECERCVLYGTCPHRDNAKDIK